MTLPARPAILAAALLALAGCAAVPALAQGPIVRYGDPVPRDVREMYDAGIRYLVRTQDASGDWKDGEYDIVTWLVDEHPPSVDWKTATLPELAAQPNMPDAATAPAHPATDVPFKVDLASIKVPSKPA